MARKEAALEELPLFASAQPAEERLDRDAAAQAALNRERADEALRALPRPPVLGDPLRLETNPSLPKPLSQIEIVEIQGRLTLADRKLYNVLLAESWDRLEDPEFPGPFRAPAADLRRAIGQRTQDKNIQLRDSLRRLRKSGVKFQRIVDGQQNAAETSLISYFSLPQGHGTVEWNFEPVLRPYLAQPGKWARCYLATCAKFRSKYALSLYELLCARVNLKNRRWEVSVDDLRAFLGVQDKYKGWDRFEGLAFGPAVEAVNEHAHFTVAVERVRAPSSRRIDGVVFRFALKPDARELTAAPRARRDV